MVCNITIVIVCQKLGSHVNVFLLQFGQKAKQVETKEQRQRNWPRCRCSSQV
jgi:hypothetical protein